MLTDAADFGEGAGRLLWQVFFGSLALSLIASLCNPVLARDAALYMDIASIAQHQGVHAALQRFDWPWFSVLLGWLHSLVGANIELIARFVCELLTALACVLAVDVVRRSCPGLAGWAALTVLALPAFNQYRGDIIRENGFWCFSMLALWALFAWERSRLSRYLLLMFIAVVTAAMFRLEALYLLAVAPVVGLIRSSGECSRRIVLSAFFAFCLILVVLALLSALHHGWLPPGRVSEYAERLNLQGLYGGFAAFAMRLAASMPFDYAREDAGLILFLGLFGYLIYKIVGTLGVFVAPFFFGARAGGRGERNPWLILDVAALGYCIILLLFLVEHLFLSMRYVAFLGFLLLPRVVVGIRLLTGRWPRLKRPFIILSLILSLAGVVSISPPKTHLQAAGVWVGQNLPRGARIYMDDNRLSYFAGWGYGTESRDLDAALALTGADAYEYFALDLKRKAEPEIARLKQQGLRPVVEFHNRRGETYVVFHRDTSPPFK